MIRLSIKRKIIGIALILIALMTVTALISLALVMQVSGRLEELTQSYAPAYAALARANVHSLERAVALRRMVIEKIQSPPDEARYADARKRFEESGATVERELKAARNLLDALIAKGSSFGDATALVRVDTRLADAVDTPACISTKKSAACCRCSKPAKGRRSSTRSSASMSCATISIVSSMKCAPR
jgi:hypothetical protein